MLDMCPTILDERLKEGSSMQEIYDDSDGIHWCYGNISEEVSFGQTHLLWPIYTNSHLKIECRIVNTCFCSMVIFYF